VILLPANYFFRVLDNVIEKIGEGRRKGVREGA